MMKTGAKELAAGDADSAFPHNDFRLEIAKQLITSRLEAGSKDQTAVVELFAALQAAERPANSVLCAKLATMFWAAGAPFELNLSSPQKTAAATACTAGPSGSPDLAKLNAILAATTWHSSNGWLHQKIAPVTDFTIAEVTNNCGEYLNLAA